MGGGGKSRQITGLARILNRVMALMIRSITLQPPDHKTSADQTAIAHIDQMWPLMMQSDHTQLKLRTGVITSYSSSAITWIKDLKGDVVVKPKCWIIHWWEILQSILTFRMILTVIGFDYNDKRWYSLSIGGLLSGPECNSGNIASRRFKFSSHARSHVPGHWPGCSIIYFRSSIVDSLSKDCEFPSMIIMRIMLTWYHGLVLLTYSWSLEPGWLASPWSSLSWHSSWHWWWHDYDDDDDDDDLHLIWLSRSLWTLMARLWWSRNADISSSLESESWDIMIYILLVINILYIYTFPYLSLKSKSSFVIVLIAWVRILGYHHWLSQNPDLWTYIVHIGW